MEDDEAIPSVSCDHAYMTVDGSLDTIPHLLIRAHTTTACAATTFSKTGVHQHAVQFFVGFTRDLQVPGGRRKTLFALQTVVRDAMPDVDMIFKGGLVGDHAGGAAENADKVVKRQVVC